MLQKTALWALSVITFLVVAMYIAFQVSRWPSVLYHRHYGRFRQIIDHGWFGLQRTLERYAVTARLDERFDTNDPDAALDVYYPSEVANTDRKLPTIAWVHGGGFTSGSKDGVAHYLTVLAAKITRSSASLLAGAGQDLSDADLAGECGSHLGRQDKGAISAGPSGLSAGWCSSVSCVGEANAETNEG